MKKRNAHEERKRYAHSLCCGGMGPILTLACRGRRARQRAVKLFKIPQLSIESCRRGHRHLGGKLDCSNLQQKRKGGLGACLERGLFLPVAKKGRVGWAVSGGGAFSTSSKRRGGWAGAVSGRGAFSTSSKKRGGWAGAVSGGGAFSHLIDGSIRSGEGARAPGRTFLIDEELRGCLHEYEGGPHPQRCGGRGRERAATACIRSLPTCQGVVPAYFALVATVGWPQAMNAYHIIGVLYEIRVIGPVETVGFHFEA